MSELTGLPEGWAYIKLGDICEIRHGYAFKSEDFGEVGPILLTPGNFTENGKLDFVNKRVVRLSGSYDKQWTLNNGDLLVVMTDLSQKKLILGVAAILNSEEVVLHNQRIGLVVPFSEAICRKYLRYGILNPYFKKHIDTTATGTLVTHTSPTKLLDGSIALPPLNEQKRIVAKIEELNDRTQKAKEALEAIPQLCDRFRQSVLAAAFRGDLTADWRKQNLELEPNSTENFPNIPFVPPIFIGETETPTPFSWSWVSLIDVATLESGHTPRKSVPEYWEGGDVPWICLQDIRAADGKIIYETLFKTTMLGIKNSSARLLPEGTVCFSRDISVGFVTIMGRSMATTQHFANWICDSRLFNQYLMYAFMASRSSLIQSGEGTTVRTIYMPALKKMRILMPSIAEQKEIVFKIQSIFKAIDNIEKQYQQSNVNIDKINQSILAKAFRGELVPQDPYDESAFVLLERIRAEREQLNSSKPKTNLTSTTSKGKRKSNIPEGQESIPGLE